MDNNWNCYGKKSVQKFWVIKTHIKL
jgi:hypothetical protein